MKSLKIAARKSDLARIQAYEVAEALQKIFPDLSIEFHFSQSLGDKNLQDPLWQMPEKGVFTRDLQQALIEGSCDLVVHSWKDLPVEGFDLTEVAATLVRREMRDVLLLKKDSRKRFSSGAAQPLKILSSSPRRAHNLGILLPELLPFKPSALEFVPVRGNVGTRIEKLIHGDGDGLIVAGAALDRLLAPPRNFEPQLLESAQALKAKMADLRWMLLPLKENPTAAAQGALAIEVLRSRKDVKALLSRINHPETFSSVTRERTILKTYGGGCHQKLGISVLTKKFGEVLSTRGLDERDGTPIHRWEMVSQAPPVASPVEPSEILPLKPEDSSFFRRKPIALEWPADADAFFISRADAMPDSWETEKLQSKILWASGLQTWKKLAERGLWIHGSAEGLGETIPRFALIPEAARWLKLSHREGADSIPLLPTYELAPKAPEESPRFSNKKHYFWMSASAFERALQLDPSILRAEHACGPGNTFERLQKHVQRDGLKLRLCLDFDSWKQSLLADSRSKN
jgi:hydroxymethylbilane synthase